MIPLRSKLNTITFSWGCAGPGGGHCGTAAFRPVRAVGLMVMKITSNTRRMSMNGVTLISARGSILRRFFFKLLLRVVVVITDSKRGGFVPSGVRRTMRLSGFEHHRLGPARRFVLGFL